MPRRIADYAPDRGWNLLNLVSTIGAYIIAVAMLLFLVNVIITLRKPRTAPDDPWGANTLEWATSSPPPAHNFDPLPPIRSERPVHDLRFAGEEAEDMSAVAMPERRTQREMSGPVLGMVLFVASEAMFFAALFGAYFTIKANAKEWPPAGIEHLKIDVASILTVILVLSSVVIQLSLRSIRRGDQRRAVTFLAVTIALGVTFLLLQFYDYSQLGFGLKDGAFGTLFYVMTGIHMAHVFGGVVFLALVLVQSMSGMVSPSNYDSLAAGAIYWDFVDVVWLLLFTTFYLLTPR